MMKKTIGVLAGLFLSACGTELPAGRELKAGCLTFYTNNAINQSDLIDNVELAQKVLTYEQLGVVHEPHYPAGDPLIFSEDRFCSAFQGTQLFIQPDEEWHCLALDPGKECVGVAYDNGVVKLGSDTNALAHELIHVWDRLHGVNSVDNSNHKDWLDTGRFDLDRIYTAHFKPL